jgi:hypothetical protein
LPAHDEHRALVAPLGGVEPAMRHHIAAALLAVTGFLIIYDRLPRM